MPSSKTFHLVLIKPSRYDDRGYVIQWFRSWFPSNTLAVLNSLSLNCASRKVLGDDVTFAIDTYDENNVVIPIKTIIRKIKRAGCGMVGLVGVQTNQFPRAVDLATTFRNAGIPVVIGGFHVSGSLAMLPGISSEIQSAIDKGITIFAGEAEGRLDGLIRDAYEGQLKPVYNFVSDLPSLDGMPAPFLPVDVLRKNYESWSSFDAGRGCPFQCSFCTIINVQGRKSRTRSPDCIEALVRANYQLGINRYFITDDDFVRNKDWEQILDRLIRLRQEEDIKLSITIQVDTLCHKVPRFIEKAARAGCQRVFIGIESVNPDSLASAQKGQNKIWEYRRMIQAWKDQGSVTYAGYILGFPTDSPKTIARDLEILKRELPIDLVIFFILTPLPGSEDHQNLYRQGVWMDPDLNKYNDQYVTTTHPLMSAKEWQNLYHTACSQFFGLKHAETVLRREAVKGERVQKLAFMLLWQYINTALEDVHVLESGFFRRRVRVMRRSGMPLENPFIFYPRRIWEVASKTVQYGALIWKFYRLAQRVEKDPKRREYRDLAITPVWGGGEEGLVLTKEMVNAIPVIQLEKGEL